MKRVILWNFQGGYMANIPWSCDPIPAEAWHEVFTKFIAAKCDSFSVRTVNSSDEFAELKQFADWQPKILKVVDYSPEHQPTETQSNNEEVTLFELSQETVNRIAKTPWEDWNSTFEYCDVLFFAGDALFARMVPDDDYVVLEHLTQSDLDDINKLGKDLVANILEPEKVGMVMKSGR